MTPMNGRALYASLMTDNRRWDALRFREGDIVISAPSKCGVTWTQRLVSLLVFDGPDLPGPLSTVSPWVDQTLRPLQDVVATLEAQRHRRFVKTHTPLDGLPLDDRVTYIGVGRDPRDAAVSHLFQESNMDKERMQALNESVVSPHERYGSRGPGSVPPGFPGPAPNRSSFAGREPSLAEEFRHWMEGPAAPPPGTGFMPPKAMGSLANILHQFGTLWDRRHLPNVALFHFADYQTDLVGELLRLADILGYRLSRGRAAQLAACATFDAMKTRAADLVPNATDGIWHSNELFFRSGRSGEWQQIFTEVEHRRYYHRINTLAPPDLLAWAHEGRRGRDPGVPG